MKRRKKAEDGKKDSFDGYVYYGSNGIQGGNVQVYESNDIGGSFFGSDIIFDPDMSVVTSYYFSTSSPVEIRGYLPADGNNAKGLLLYGASLFPDNICTFAGSLFFSYMKSDEGIENTLSVFVPLAV